MATHPFHDVAIVGVHNTEQARVLEGHDARTVTLAAALGALADAGLCPRDNTSGTHRGRSKLSGRGRPELRVAAWRAGWGGASWWPRRASL